MKGTSDAVVGASAFPGLGSGIVVPTAIVLVMIRDIRGGCKLPLARHGGNRMAGTGHDESHRDDGCEEDADEHEECASK